MMLKKNLKKTPVMTVKITILIGYNDIYMYMISDFFFFIIFTGPVAH